MPPPTYTLFVGTFIHLPGAPASTPSGAKHTLSVHHGALWVSAAGGRIAGCEWDVSLKSDEEVDAWLEKRGWVRVDDHHPDPSEKERRDKDGEEREKVTVRVVRAREQRNEFFFPGFVDTHIHASQYPNTGIFGSSTLLDWLEKYTFPLEKSYGDGSDEAPPQARIAYNRVISRTLANGTTCAAYYATIHVPATNLLATLCHVRGQRALIGRVCMDNPAFCPEDYRDASPDASVAATEATIAHIRRLDPEGTLIHPIVTPRFAPTCSPAALSALGKLASSSNPPLHVQTHISENTNEVALVRDLFPESSSYADVYDRHGLLTPRTILAHAVHLRADERALIRARAAKVSHCPASNAALGSGLCPVRTLLDDGITVGLGTDISGGYSASMLEAVRQACLVSRLLRFSHHQRTGEPTGREKLSVEEALYLATRGGAQCVDLADRIGGFDVGLCFDAQLIELGRVHPEDGRDPAGTDDRGSVGNVDVFGWESWEEKVHKWVWSGDDRNVRAVWVNGRLVHERGKNLLNP